MNVFIRSFTTADIKFRPTKIEEVCEILEREIIYEKIKPNLMNRSFPKVYGRQISEIINKYGLKNYSYLKLEKKKEVFQMNAQMKKK